MSIIELCTSKSSIIINVIFVSIASETLAEAKKHLRSESGSRIERLSPAVS